MSAGRRERGFSCCPEIFAVGDVGEAVVEVFEILARRGAVVKVFEILARRGTRERG